MDLISITLVISAFIILALGFVVIYDSREKLNRIYFINIVAILSWLIAMIYYRMSTEANIVFWTKILYISASLIASDFLYFTYVFPKYKKISIVKKSLIFIPNILLILVIWFGSKIITGATVNLFTENEIYWGYLYPVYVFYILFYFDFAFYRLWKEIHQSKDRTEKLQLAYVLVGYMASGLIAFTTNLILPSFGIFKLNWVGQVSTVLMAISATYAIVKHRLFNAKVIVTELLVFTIWIVLLLRLLISSSVSEYVVNSIVLIMTFVVGIFLIKSVIKEITQRERIELLAKDLEKANGNQKNLIHVMNHQIKGKLGDARTAFAELLTDDYGEIPEAARTIVRRGLEETERGVDYVQSILKGTSAESGTLPYEMAPMDLRRTAVAAAEQLRERAAAKGLSFEIKATDGDYMMRGDARQIGEACRNLVDNSVNYTQKGAVHVWLHREGGKAVFAVQDTGIGLSDEDKPKLFLSGGRGKDSIKYNVNSTGYGLSFVKGVVEAHGGRVWAESDGPGRGSSFYMELPLNIGPVNMLADKSDQSAAPAEQLAARASV